MKHLLLSASHNSNGKTAVGVFTSEDISPLKVGLFKLFLEESATNMVPACFGTVLVSSEDGMKHEGYSISLMGIVNIEFTLCETVVVNDPESQYNEKRCKILAFNEGRDLSTSLLTLKVLEEDATTVVSLSKVVEA